LRDHYYYKPDTGQNTGSIKRFGRAGRTANQMTFPAAAPGGPVVQVQVPVLRLLENGDFGPPQVIPGRVARRTEVGFDDPVLAMGATQQGESIRGVTMVLGRSFDTTGVFGVAGDAESGFEERGFPWSVTIPGHRDLATGRRWHFFFAWLFLLNGLAYLIWSLGSGHLRRDLAPSGKELKHVGASIVERG